MTHPSEPQKSTSPVCLITGGSSGIGLATAKKLATHGYQIAICGRSQERLATATSQIQAAQPDVRILAVPGNLEDVKQSRDLVATVEQHFGRLDVLVNNAAAAPLSPLEDVSEEQFESLTNLNIRSVFYLTQTAWKIMQRQQSGMIVNVSSMAAVDPFPGFSLYGASKAWIELWTQALSAEGKDQGIQSFAVRPGAVETPLLRGLFPDFPADQCVPPEAIADCIWDCISQPDQYPGGKAVQVTQP